MTCTLRHPRRPDHGCQGKTDTQRLCHRYSAGAGAYRDRRKVQRDTGGAETAGRARCRGPYRHAGRDALPKKTFETADEAQAHLIVQLKDNQLTLCRKAEAVCNDTKPLSGVQTVDSKKRNRHETRTVAVFDALPAVAGTEWEPYVAAIIAIERSVLTFQPATPCRARRRRHSQTLGHRKQTALHARRHPP